MTRQLWVCLAFHSNNSRADCETEAAQSKHKSDAYKHYNMTLECSESNGQRTMTFVFTCKFHDKRHNTIRRPRDLPYNTSNMIATAKMCIKRDP